MKYFDDQSNFISHPELNSLVNADSNVLSHFWALLCKKGLNVYEPVSSILKAFIIDIVGLNPLSLRIVSLLNHSINSILLFIWLNIVLVNSKVQMCFWLITCEVLVCGLFCVHPLNVEVIGWLSAQGYLYSLMFSLFACLLFEYSWFKGCNYITVDKKLIKKNVEEAQKQVDEQLLDRVSHLLAGSMVCYIAAVLVSLQFISIIFIIFV